MIEKRTNRIFLCIIFCVLALPVVAQNPDFEKFREQQRASFEQFRSTQQDKYDAFRQSVNAEYAEFMRAAWAEFPVREADEPVEEKRIEPVIYEEDSDESAESKVKGQRSKVESGETEEGVEEPPTEETSDPQVGTNFSFSFRGTKSGSQPAAKAQPSRQIPAQAEVKKVPQAPPAPEPIAPVKVSESAEYQKTTVTYYGRNVTFGFPLKDNLRLVNLGENAIADAWLVLSGKPYDITVKSALDARSGLQLCDWAYMDLLRQAAEAHYGVGNEATLMTAFLMTQSGYKVRLAKAAERLYMLVASQYQIYNMRYLSVDGTKFYVTGNYGGERLQLCPSRFDKEQSVSLQLAVLPKLGENATPKRKLTSKKGVTASVSVNKNLIDFFGRYPQANIDGDFTTRWAAYANTPLDRAIKDELYPPLKQTIAGMNERDAVGILLNWVQTAFKYGYDDEVWGGDRAFFAQETLYYPQSDCEDRAILFSRLVRDLTGLDVALIYYPGHLAAAVCFKGEVAGDWVDCSGRRFVICDPTYINAPVGHTMPGMDNQTAKIILLQ